MVGGDADVTEKKPSPGLNCDPLDAVLWPQRRKLVNADVALIPYCEIIDQTLAAGIDVPPVVLAVE